MKHKLKLSFTILFLIGCFNANCQQGTVAPDPRAGMSVNDFNDLMKKDKVILIDFSAPWCKPCKMLAPIVDKLGEEMKDKMKVMKFNSDENHILMNKFGITGIPQLFLFKDGKMVWGNEGFIPEEDLRNALKSFL